MVLEVKRVENKSLSTLPKVELLHETVKTLFGRINDCFISCFKLCPTFDSTTIYMWNELARQFT